LNPAPIHPMLRELIEHTAVVTPNHGEVT